MHVMVPLAARTMSHDQAHRYSRTLAERMTSRQPDRLTISAALSARDGRLFIDYLRNGRGTTAVAPYSPRARRGFPITAPTTWPSLERGIRPDAYTLAKPFLTPTRQVVRARTQRQSKIPADAPRTTTEQTAKAAGVRPKLPRARTRPT